MEEDGDKVEKQSQEAREMKHRLARAGDHHEDSSRANKGSKHDAHLKEIISHLFFVIDLQ